MKLYKSLLVSAAVLAACTQIGATAQTDEVTLERQILFGRGDMESTFWRIPAIVSAPDGTVLAVADRRKDSNGDLPNKIDLAIRRSTDNGKTWSAPEFVVKADENGGYGDAAMGVHYPSGDIIIVATHGSGLWDATPDYYQHIMVMRSKDNGKTWSEPVDVTKSFFDPEEGVAPLHAIAGFATSGELLCDDNGRLMFVLVAKTDDAKYGPLACYVCYSDDGGYTWDIVERTVDDSGDEAKLTQLADGSHYLSVRNRARSGRRIARSTDGGMTWTEPRANEQLVDPACNGGLISISPETLQELGIAPLLGCSAKNGLVLHSIADNPKERKNVSVYMSKDLGVNWEKIYTVTPDGSAYSAMAMLPDGTLGIFSEEDDPAHPEGGYLLWFTKVDLKKAIEQATQCCNKCEGACEKCQHDQK